MVLVTVREPAAVGVTLGTVFDVAGRGRPTPHGGRRTRRPYDHAEAETLMLRRLNRTRPHEHRYWPSVSWAAAALSLTPSVVRQIMVAGRPPHVTATNGRRYVCVDQLDVLAKVRQAQLTTAAANLRSDSVAAQLGSALRQDPVSSREQS